MKIATMLALTALVTAAPLAAQTAVGSGTTTAAPAREDRDAARAANFAALSAPKDHSTRIDTATALRALGQVARSFDSGGTGDAEYWMKTTKDFARSGRGVGRAMQTVARAMGPGAVAAAVGGTGASLVSLDWGGSGDAYYWMARTKETAQRIGAAGQQLDAIAAALASGQPQTVPLGALLDALAQVSFTLDHSGRGDAEYWMKTARNFAHVARGIGRGVAAAAAGTPEPLGGVLRAMADALGQISEAGTGNADYWMARARGVAEQVKGTGQALREMAMSLP